MSKIFRQSKSRGPEFRVWWLIFDLFIFHLFIRGLMMPKKSPVSHTVPTRLIPDLPNTEKDLIESIGVVPAKDPPKVKLEESFNNVREYEI